MSVSREEVQSVTAFAKLPAEQIDLLAGLLIRRHYAAGELIFLEGDPSKGIWFVTEGRVRIIKFSDSGRVQALCLMNKGKCFGGCPLFNMDQNPANAQALDAVSLLILRQEEIAHLQHNNPLFIQILLQIYSDRLALLARLGEGLGTWSVGMRINDTLLNYVNDQDGRLIVQLTHEKLAHLVGSVREVVTRHLIDLEQSGVIRQESGQLEILQLDELRSACIMGKV